MRVYQVSGGFWMSVFFVSASMAHGWTQAVAPLNIGHEELTRLSVAIASGNYGTIPEGQVANDSENALILGNFAMDFPYGSGGGLDRFDKVHRADFIAAGEVLISPQADANSAAMIRDMTLSMYETLVGSLTTGFAFFGGDGVPTWQEDPLNQPLHFLRVPGMTTKTSCETAREKIKTIVMLGTMFRTIVFDAPTGNAYEQQLIRLFRDIQQFHIGAALHTVQDSFSGAHTKRANNGTGAITNLCIYKDDNPAQGVCVHEALDSQDRIWIDGSSTVLRPEAHAAVAAGAVFLSKMATLRTKADTRMGEISTHMEQMLQSVTPANLAAVTAAATAYGETEMEKVREMARNSIDELTFLSCGSL